MFHCDKTDFNRLCWHDCTVFFGRFMCVGLLTDKPIMHKTGWVLL